MIKIIKSRKNRKQETQGDVARDVLAAATADWFAQLEAAETGR